MYLQKLTNNLTVLQKAIRFSCFLIHLHQIIKLNYIIRRWISVPGRYKALIPGGSIETSSKHLFSVEFFIYWLYKCVMRLNDLGGVHCFRNHNKYSEISLTYTVPKKIH